MLNGPHANHSTTYRTLALCTNFKFRHLWMMANPISTIANQTLVALEKVKLHQTQKYSNQFLLTKILFAIALILGLVCVRDDKTLYKPLLTRYHTVINQGSKETIFHQPLSLHKSWWLWGVVKLNWHKWLEVLRTLATCLQIRSFSKSKASAHQTGSKSGLLRLEKADILAVSTCNGTQQVCVT